MYILVMAVYCKYIHTGRMDNDFWGEIMKMEMIIYSEVRLVGVWKMIMLL